jgi:hypothetical protein
LYYRVGEQEKNVTENRKLVFVNGYYVFLYYSGTANSLNAVENLL